MSKKKTKKAAQPPKLNQKSLKLRPEIKDQLDRLAAEYGQDRNEFLGRLFGWCERQERWTILWVMGLVGASGERAFGRAVSGVATEIEDILEAPAGAKDKRRARPGAKLSEN